MKYIDADELKAFKEALTDIIVSSQGLCTYDACKEQAEQDTPILLATINTLKQEQSEVDLEKAINGLCAGWIEGEEYGELQNVNTANCVTLEEVKEAMRCTFELGLKARKEKSQ